MAGKFSKVARPAAPLITTPKELGAWIRARRVESSLRIDDAAALCGVSVQLLSDLENGGRAVGIDKVFAVTNALGLDLRVTLRGEAEGDFPDENNLTEEAGDAPAV